ncbi:hypothetical protein RJ640_027855 [Escallonia rubra]|uniref:Uncharacterized protein n=1 Tax=Escallonia rubra TaxID=112253 RepID=A0AA88RN40_9ASTE|nr:hypothetical protein RJ640_027855 [Escallonia rubra]
MLNRYTQNRLNGTRNFAEPRERFVLNTTWNPTLRQGIKITHSNFLWQSKSDTYVSASSGGAAPPSTVGSRTEENGALFPMLNVVVYCGWLLDQRWGVTGCDGGGGYGVEVVMLVAGGAAVFEKMSWELLTSPEVDT